MFTNANASPTVLIKALRELPDDWQIVPVGNNKQPLGRGWQNNPHSPSQLAQQLTRLNGRVWVIGKNDRPYLVCPQGYGLLTGVAPHYFIAVDLDGTEAGEQLTKLSRGRSLPATVAFCSGRTGHCQYLFEMSHPVKTSMLGNLQIRGSGSMSVLPPSVHPLTGRYYWLSHPQKRKVASVPEWLREGIDRVSERSEASSELTNPSFTTRPVIKKWKEEESRIFGSNQQTDLLPSASCLLPLPKGVETTQRAIELLWKIHFQWADLYDSWLRIGMALKSVDPNLLSQWDLWSQQSSKYLPGECEYKWNSFKRVGITIGSLYYYANLT